MKKTAPALIILVILALLALPLGAFAEAQAAPDAFALTVDNFKVTLAGAPAVDVGLALNVSAGLNQARDRGLWAVDVSGGSGSVITLLAALENGKIRGTAHNALGGLPYVVEAPLDALAGMAQAMVPLSPDLAGAGGAGQFSGLLESGRALGEAAKDPAFREKLRAKVWESFLGMNPVEEKTIELFGEEHSAQVYTGETDFEGLLAALPGIFAVDPALDECFREVVRLLDESGAFGQGATFADLPKLLKKNGNQIQVAFSEYVAGEEQSRLEIAMTALEKGAEAGTLTLTFDSDLRPGRQAVALSLATDVPGAAEKNVRVALQSSATKRGGGEDGYFGLLVETGGEGGGTIAVQLETQRDDAAPGAAAKDDALLSLALISAADQSSYAAAIRYQAENLEVDGRPAADGRVTAEVLQNGSSLAQLSFDTLFQSAGLSDGELFTFDDSYTLLDVTAMTEAQGQALSEAAGTLFNNTLGLLFQVPGVAAFLGGGQ